MRMKERLLWDINSDVNILPLHPPRPLLLLLVPTKMIFRKLSFKRCVAKNE
jgi:hypothetical protein